jgi:hypothetical protein
VVATRRSIDLLIEEGFQALGGGFLTAKIRIASSGSEAEAYRENLRQASLFIDYLTSAAGRHDLKTPGKAPS